MRVGLRVAPGVWVGVYPRLPRLHAHRRCTLRWCWLVHVLYWVVVGSLVLHFALPILIYLAWRRYRANGARRKATQ